jgi:heme exporter protein D
MRRGLDLLYLSALGGPGFHRWADCTTTTATMIRTPPTTWTAEKRSPQEHRREEHRDDRLQGAQQ